MKAIILALSLFVTVNQAKAEFFPNQARASICAFDVESDYDAIQSVCFGAQDDEQVLMISYKLQGRSGTAVLPILSIVPQNSGITGTRQALIVTALVEGDIAVPFYGIGTVGDIKSLSGDFFGHKFNAENFVPVLTTL